MQIESIQQKTAHIAKLRAVCSMWNVASGACVLVKMGGNRYRIDNSKLNDRAHGVCFRLSKNIEDRDDEHIAYWNDYVDGVDTGDGWSLGFPFLFFQFVVWALEWGKW